MKNIILSIAILLIPLVSFSQSNVVNELFDKYSGEEGYTSVYISSFMFSMMSEIETEDKEFDELVDNLKNIKILACDDGNKSMNNRFKKEIIDQIPTEDYKEMMIVKDGDEKVQFLVNEKAGTIYELLILTTSDYESALISIQGKLNMKQISKLSKSVKIDGLEHLDEIEE